MGMTMPNASNKQDFDAGVHARDRAALRHDLADLGRLAAGMAQKLKSIEQRLPSDDVSISVARRVRTVIDARRHRNRAFPGLFADPAWDLLLELLLARLEGRTCSVSEVATTAEMAPSTCLRWISRLEREGALVRDPSPSDGRKSSLQLSDDWAERMCRLMINAGMDGAALL
jgi:hypothetical protein